MINNKWKSCAVAAVCAVLGACGGGGAGGVSGPGTGSAPLNNGRVTIQGGPFQANVGSSIQITAVASTAQTLITSMAWTVLPKDATAPALTVVNANCAAAIKNDDKYANTTIAATGNSNWSCSLLVEASPKLSADTTYTATVTMVDDKNNSTTANTDFKYTASGTGGAGNLSASAGGAFSIKQGATAPLSCSAGGGASPYTYEWLVKDNAGLSFALSSYSSAQSSFVAPDVTAATTVTLQCNATDSNGRTALPATVKATIQPQAAIVALPVALPVANAGTGYFLKPGATAPLSCSASGGKAPYTYAWSVLVNGGYPISLSSYNSALSSFIAPTTIASPTRMILECKATDSAGASSPPAGIMVIVSPTAVPPVTAAAGVDFSSIAGTEEPLHCAGGGGIGMESSDYAYQWSIVDNAGYNVTLSSYSTLDTTFTSPAVGGPAKLTFRCTVTQEGLPPAQDTVAVNVTLTGVNILLADAGIGSEVNPGQEGILDGSATGWFNTIGARIPQGPNITYLWTTTTPGVTIYNPTSKMASFVATGSSWTNTAGTADFRLDVKSVAVTSGTSTPISSSFSTVKFVVDPYAPFTLTVTKPSQIFSFGAGSDINVSLNAVASNTGKPGEGTPTLYYQWTTLSSPVPTASVIIGGNTTANAGFVAQKGVDGLGVGVYVFQVAVGYQPISGKIGGTIDGIATGYKGIYFATATVVITP